MTSHMTDFIRQGIIRHKIPYLTMNVLNDAPGVKFSIANATSKHVYAVKIRYNSSEALFAVTLARHSGNANSMMGKVLEVGHAYELSEAVELFQAMIERVSTSLPDEVIEVMHAYGLMDSNLALRDLVKGVDGLSVESATRECVIGIYFEDDDIVNGQWVLTLSKDINTAPFHTVRDELLDNVVGHLAFYYGNLKSGHTSLCAKRRLELE